MFLTCLIFFSVILLAWKAQPVSPDPWTGTPGMCIPLLELFLTSWTSKYSSPGPYIHSQPFPFGPHSCKDVCIYLIVETGEVFSDWELKVLVKSSTWIFVRPGFELCTLRLCWIGIIKCEAFKANLPVAPPQKSHFWCSCLASKADFRLGVEQGGSFRWIESVPGFLQIAWICPSGLNTVRLKIYVGKTLSISCPNQPINNLCSPKWPWSHLSSGCCAAALTTTKTGELVKYFGG